jgi:hypothetical protein
MELKFCLVWAEHYCMESSTTMYVFSKDETHHFIIVITLNTAVLISYRFHMCNTVHETIKALSMPYTTTNSFKNHHIC